MKHKYRQKFIYLKGANLSSFLAHVTLGVPSNTVNNEHHGLLTLADHVDSEVVKFGFNHLLFAISESLLKSIHL